MRPQTSWFDTGLGSVPVAGNTARYNRFTALAALINRLLLRKEVGLDLLSVGNIVIVALALLVLQWFDNLHFSLFALLGGGVIYGNHTSLRNFAIAWAALALFERFQRLEEEKRGVEPHTLSPGVGRFGIEEFLPLSPKVIALGVEPGLAFLAGAALRRLGFSMLGWVILGSAVCFAISEWRFYSQEKRHKRDLRNIDKEARREAELMNQGGAQQAGPSSQAASGLATGIDGLEDSIGKHKQEGDEDNDAALAGGAL
jgi:hypothetical protein